MLFPLILLFVMAALCWVASAFVQAPSAIHISQEASQLVNKAEARAMKGLCAGMGLRRGNGVAFSPCTECSRRDQDGSRRGLQMFVGALHSGGQTTLRRKGKAGGYLSGVSPAPPAGEGATASSNRTRQTKLDAAVLLDTKPLTSVERMREVYGQRKNWWGDLNAHETRTFYHELLPVSLQFDDANSDLTLEERARIASMARHAARLYARERCALPSRLMASVYDGYRHFKMHGSWSWTGMTWDEVWEKYELQVLDELGYPATSMGGAGPETDHEKLHIRKLVCRRILDKSCQTNQMFDKLAGMAPEQMKERKSEREKVMLKAMALLARRRPSRSERAAARLKKQSTPTRPA